LGDADIVGIEVTTAELGTPVWTGLGFNDGQCDGRSEGDPTSWGKLSGAIVVGMAVGREVGGEVKVGVEGDGLEVPPMVVSTLGENEGCTVNMLGKIVGVRS